MTKAKREAARIAYKAIQAAAREERLLAAAAADKEAKA